ncbi:hypothetical protein RJT34_23986 [Clitoria ternatea]|uniref:Uncharacterized protein n=1 Tax=Clitoria ternatea TaxID=43366 RepID=A0AAN9FMG5_CLITE
MNNHILGQNALGTLENVTIICPKPNRNGIYSNRPIRPLRCKVCHQQEGEKDSKVGTEILDIISKNSYGEEHNNITTQEVLPASPPFFHGSPPVRTSNPLIQDAQFGYGKDTVESISPSSSQLFSPSSLLHYDLFYPRPQPSPTTLETSSANPTGLVPLQTPKEEIIKKQTIRPIIKVLPPRRAIVLTTPKGQSHIHNNLISKSSLKPLSWVVWLEEEEEGHAF